MKVRWRPGGKGVDVVNRQMMVKERRWQQQGQSQQAFMVRRGWLQSGNVTAEAAFGISHLAAGAARKRGAVWYRAKEQCPLPF